MGIPQYLAMTAAESALHPTVSGPVAWLGCSFDEKGLAGLPEALPPDAILILDDRIPMTNQGNAEIAAVLEDTLSHLACRGLLLDFQRPEVRAQRALAAYLYSRLSIPMAAPPDYAPKGCPIFLPPIPPDTTVETALAPWAGQEIWLDTTLAEQTLHLTAAGCIASENVKAEPTEGFYDEALCCLYRIQRTDDGFLFRLFRDRRCTQALLERAAKMGVTLAMGLWQEFGLFP